MITSIDSNVIIGLWNADDTLNPAALTALDAAFSSGGLVICGAVYAELLALPKRTEEFVDTFLTDTQIAVDWTSSESIWRTAGQAFQGYDRRRRKQKINSPRRILADFFIGAHALENSYSLLTLDERIYGAAFPKLHITSV